MKVYHWPAVQHHAARTVHPGDIPADTLARAHNSTMCADYQCGRLHWTEVPPPYCEVCGRERCPLKLVVVDDDPEGLWLCPACQRPGEADRRMRINAGRENRPGGEGR